MPARRRRWAVAAAVAGGLTLSACGGSQAGAVENDPWVAWADSVEELRRNTESEFVLAILEDGVITSEEAREALLRQIDCMNDHGLAVSLWEIDGSRGLAHPGEWTDEHIRIELLCEAQWGGGIESLYTMIQNDPGNQGRSEVFAACLVRHGLAPEGFTGSQYDELTGVAEHNAAWQAIWDEIDASGVEQPSEAELEELFGDLPELREAYLPGWGYLRTPETEDQYWECLVHPQR